MSMSVDVNPAAETVRATRSIRKSGNSNVISLPPQALQALDLDAGDQLEVEADWGDGEIRLRKVEE